MSTTSDLSIQNRLGAAVGASAMAALVTHPLEVLKSRLQASLPAVGVASRVCTATCSGGECVLPGNASWAAPARSGGAGPSSQEMLRSILRTEGAAALYRGLPHTLVAALPTVAIYLPMYDALRDRFEGSLGGAAPLAAGTISRSCAVLVVAPLELVRTRMMSLSAAQLAGGLEGGTSGVGGVGDLLRIRDGGGAVAMLRRASTLWTGAASTLLRDVPFTAIFWSLTEPLRRVILPVVDSNTSTMEIVAANALAAGAAGAVSAAVTTPFDVIKTQQQISGASAGVWSTGQRIFDQGGWSALFRGTALRSARAVPACALVVATYEVLKHQLGRYHPKENGSREEGLAGGETPMCDNCLSCGGRDWMLQSYYSD